jgi:hypothetical protein
MAPRRKLSDATGEAPEEMRQKPEFVSDAPEPGAGLVLADAVHKAGAVYEKGTAVQSLPEPLRSVVLAHEGLAVQPE